MNIPEAVEILVVEDNPNDLELTLRSLRKAKISNSVHICRDGAEASDYIFCEGDHANRRIEDIPRVILLDLKLPKIDGLELLKRLKEDHRTKSIPVVILTSSREQSDIIKSYQLGTNSYIVKPVDFENFSHAVQQLGMYWLIMNQPPK